MNIFSDLIGNLSIKKPVGDNLDNNEDDVRTVRVGLQTLGHIKPEDGELDYTGKPLGIITTGLETGIKNFQRERGLKVDGYLNPSGETIKAMNEGQALKKEVYKQNPCERQEISYANASAAYHIVEQNLQKAQKNLRDKQAKLSELINQRDKEKIGS